MVVGEVAWTCKGGKGGVVVGMAVAKGSDTKWTFTSMSTLAVPILPIFTSYPQAKRSAHTLSKKQNAMHIR